MPQYMLLIYNPVDGGPTREQMGELHQRWMAYGKALKDAGQLVSNQGLKGAEAATTVRVRDGERQITDGPFAETKELLAGVFQVDVPDLDAAIEWAARMPSSEYGSIEVRPIWG
jgi:hypothetical protein